MGRSKLDVSHRWVTQKTKEGKNEIKLENDVMKWNQTKGKPCPHVNQFHRQQPPTSTATHVCTCNFLRHSLRFGHVLLLHYCCLLVFVVCYSLFLSKQILLLIIIITLLI